MFNATEAYKARLIARINELIREEGRDITRLEGAYHRVIKVIQANDIPEVMSEPHAIKQSKEEV